ncbi:MAG: uroporphyrinogen decarboxylase family protein [Anaerolineae bacterium]
MLTSKQRVRNTLSYRGYDRMATVYHATPEFHRELVARLGVEDDEQLDVALGVDLRSVSATYIGPELRKFPDGSWEGIWGERYNNVPYEHGTYPEAVYLPYAGITDVSELNRLRFPSADWLDYSTLKEQCEAKADYAIVYGGAGMPDFMNGIARCRGVEQVLLDVGNRDPVFLKLMEKRHEYFIESSERALKAAEGRIDILALGEDYGSQRGLLISPRTFDRLFRPYMQEYIDLAHKYGAVAMLHSCGSVRDLIPRFIDMGLDILDVVQVDAAGMDIRDLHREFYGKIAFCGSMSVQSTLPFGTPDDVRREVALRQELFRDGGMIIGPTHAIQPLTPVDNVIVMYQAIGSLTFPG